VKRYETRQGQTVRLLCVDAKISGHPVIGLVTYGDGTEIECTWTSDGYYYAWREEYPLDLTLALSKGA